MTRRCPDLGGIMLLALCALACTKNPYVIGSVCPPALTDGGAAVDPRCATSPASGMLAADLDTSGASLLGALGLAGGSVSPALRLRGELATATAWPADGGAATLARSTGAPVPGLAAPFTDGTGAVGLPADAPAYVASDATVGAVGADDFTLEVVLRAAAGASVLDKHAGATGWSLHASVAGQLLLDLGDGAASHAVEIASSPLVTGAWYHCLFWVSRAAGGRADCDGAAGTLAPLPALGALDAPAAMLAVGGGAAAQLAEVALFRVPPGGLGAPTTWGDVSARRFTMLAGVYPRLAGGTALPVAGLRASPAYLDLQAATGARRLFFVGADWPRVACRLDAAGERACGYLSEPRRTRFVPTDAPAWTPSAIAVAAGTVPFVDGEARFAALAPSATSATHAVSFTATAGMAHQVFSFFVHRVSAARVGAGAGAFGTAVFDLTVGRLVSAPPGVEATIEPWGAGIFRCTYAFDAPDGATTYAVRLLDDGGNETFAGAGTATLDLGGLQVDVGLIFAGSLLGADAQPADHLTFVGDDGNFPTGTSGALALRLLVPAGQRLTDQAILNVNHDGSFADQVQLFVPGKNALGPVEFWGLSGGAMHWHFDSGASVTDGDGHDVTATWDASSARLVIDQTSAGMPALIPNAQSFGLNRIDVGFSESSSGALEGLVANLRIGAM